MQDEPRESHPNEAQPPEPGAVPPRVLGLTSRQHLVIGCVFLAALGMRCLHAWGQARNNVFFSAPIMDEEKHHEWAQLLASGEGLGDKPYFRSPLYYYCLAGIYKVCGPSLTLARLLGCLLGAASCYLIARLGTSLGGFRVGLIAGLIAALYWPLIHFDTLLLTAGLEIFLNLLMLLLLLHAVRRASLPLFLAAGVVWGLSALARPNVLAFAPGILVWILIAPRPTPRRLRKLAALALTCAGMLLVILPVTIRNRVVGGEWVLIATNGGVNFYIGNNPQSDGTAAVVPGTRPDWEGGYEDTHNIARTALGHEPTESEVSSYWLGRGLDWIKDNPGPWAELMIQKFRLFWSPVEIGNNQAVRYVANLSGSAVLYWVGFPIVACLAFAGLAGIGRNWRSWLLPVLFAFIYMATVVLFFCPARYRLPIVPVLILLAALGLTYLIDAWRARRLISFCTYGVMVAVCATFLATNPPARADYYRVAEGQEHHNMGIHYARLFEQQPELADEAVRHFRDALRLRPDDALMHFDVGRWLVRIDRPHEAGEALARSVGLNPNNMEARHQYVRYLLFAEQYAEAARQCGRIIQALPEKAEVRVDLGTALAQLKQYDEARRQFEAAIALGHDTADVHHQLGLLLGRSGDHVGALREFDQALELDAGHTGALMDSAAALGRAGRIDKVIERYQGVLRHNPDHAPAACGLAHALRQLGQTAQARTVLSEAIKHAPNSVLLHDGLAWLLATAPEDGLRDGAQAVRLARRAIELAGQPDAILLNTLAAALAETGQFDQAVSITEQVARDARAAGQTGTAAEADARLRLYRQRRPYRDVGL